jgi:zinc protease
LVSFKRKILNNGLRVLVHEDNSTPLAAINVAFDVGSRDEHPEKTGFAHLFEHLMFAGSLHVEDYDEPLQKAGGDNNAYTTNDYTTFYESLPAQNIETALWLESDRMLSLNVNKKSLEVQRRVVIEEFKETCLSEPYGDVWHHLSALMYEVHPYRWPVIGLVPAHIEKATLTDVRQFYQQWYTPRNAVLSVCGPLPAEEVFQMAEKWGYSFGSSASVSGVRYGTSAKSPSTEGSTCSQCPCSCRFSSFPNAWPVGSSLLCGGYHYRCASRGPFVKVVPTANEGAAVVFTN